MKEKSMDILTQEIEVPEIVTERANEAFTQIREETAGERPKNKKHRFISWQARAAAIAAAVIIGGGGITAAAAVYVHWTGGLKKQMNVSEEQETGPAAPEDGLVAFPNVSDTQDGITVSVAQSLADGNSIRLAFYFDGDEADMPEEPVLDSLELWLDGQELINYDWSFYDGLVYQGNGRFTLEDGTPAQETADGSVIGNYYNADGKAELDVSIPSVELETGEEVTELAGRTISVRLSGFNDMDAVYDMDAVWNLEWTLESSDSYVEAEPDASLGDSGATVTYVKLSPISVTVQYDFPKKEIPVTAYDGNGNEVQTVLYAEPPAFIGVKLKDGTVYLSIADGGACGYEEAEPDIYTASFGLSKIIDPSEVEGILFLKETYEDSEAALTIDDCYEVMVR